MARAEANGSFLITEGGAVSYIGSGGGENQIVTFNPDNSSFEDTNLENLFGRSSLSQYTPTPPTSRPDDFDLEIGDLWTSSITKLLYIWTDDEVWIHVKTINGNPVGTIIENINFATPSGYLPCNGEPCPPQFNELSELLFTNTGSTNLPLKGLGFFIKF